MLPLYLVKVPHNLGFDVIAYKEPECFWPVARWQWYEARKPTRRNKWVRFNCYRWNAIWLQQQKETTNG